MPRMSHMINIKLGRAFASLAAAATLTLSGSPASAADAPADRVLQPDRYTSDRGRALGQKYQGTLRDLNAKIYHCMPWLDVKPEGIGFYKPKPLVADCLRGRASIAQLAEGAHVIAWDGETKLGVIKPKAWADDFMLTYKVAGYTPDPRVTCP